MLEQATMYLYLFGNLLDNKYNELRGSVLAIDIVMHQLINSFILIPCLSTQRLCICFVYMRNLLANKYSELRGSVLAID